MKAKRTHETCDREITFIFIYSTKMWFKRIVPSSIESLPSSLSHTHTNRTFYFHWEIHALVNFRCTFFRSFVFSALTFHWHRRVFPPCVCECMSMDSQFIHILRMENTHVNRHFAIFFLSFFFNAVQIFESFNEMKKERKAMKWNWYTELNANTR